MVVASPWSRGGFVCSQVFDHTSVLRFLEILLSHRSGRAIKETNLSAWRRETCGDLTATFRPFQSEGQALDYPSKNSVLEGIHKAKFKELPSGYAKISRADQWKPQQEKGIRPSCALPYELHAGAKLNAEKKALDLVFEARKHGAPFHVYSPGKSGSRAYTVAAGQHLTDSMALENGRYHVRACGPNGFFREFAGSANDPLVDVQCVYTPSGNIQLRIANQSQERECKFRIIDNAYKKVESRDTAAAGKATEIVLDLASSFHWYDFSVRIEGSEEFYRRLAGRVETGKAGFSDPAMG
jgi:phospholipase C